MEIGKVNRICPCERPRAVHVNTNTHGLRGHNKQ
jgi:hypothetical protein